MKKVVAIIFVVLMATAAVFFGSKQSKKEEKVSITIERVIEYSEAPMFDIKTDTSRYRIIADKENANWTKFNSDKAMESTSLSERQLIGRLLIDAINSNQVELAKESHADVINSIQRTMVDYNYYYENISINGDSITLSQIAFAGMVGDFEDEHVIQKWYCPNKTVRNQISNATIDFHQNPGELKMMANAKGLTNEKYIVNEKFTNYIIVEDNQIIKFRKGKN